MSAAAPDFPGLDHIVEDGACIGCGLCATVSHGAVKMAFTPEMRERPVTSASLPEAAQQIIGGTCPGLVSEGLSAADAGPGAIADSTWGYWHRGFIAWAGDAAVRHRASSGGVLSALAAHLLNTGKVDFILHAGPDMQAPARSCWKISRTADEATHTGGSRYGPVAPLAGLTEARRLVESGIGRFAFIGKPCDVSAIRLLARRESWLGHALRFRLTLMCGGESEFAKTQALLDQWGISESDLAEFRYRGFGNPGPTVARTIDGRRFATTYQALWEDESLWELQHRCKICPDAIGMAADLVAFDCWPGGGPTGEDQGFNAVLTRTPVGDSLLRDAVAAGDVVLGGALDAADFELFQPHQSRKRRAVWARLAGQRAAGKLAPPTPGLGIETLALENDWRDNLRQARGTARRLRMGRGTEPKPTPVA